MENKEINKAIPVELDDDALDNVSGGVSNGGSHEVLFPSVPLLPEDDVSIEPIPDATPSIP